jgi:hypothetical protein
MVLLLLCVSNHHCSHQKHEVAESPVVCIVVIPSETAATTILFVHALEHSVLKLVKHPVNIF